MGSRGSAGSCRQRLASAAATSAGLSAAGPGRGGPAATVPQPPQPKKLPSSATTNRVVPRILVSIAGRGLGRFGSWPPMAKRHPVMYPAELPAPSGGLADQAPHRVPGGLLAPRRHARPRARPSRARTSVPLRPTSGRVDEAPADLVGRPGGAFAPTTDARRDEGGGVRAGAVRAQARGHRPAAPDAPDEIFRRLRAGVEAAGEVGEAGPEEAAQLLGYRADRGAGGRAAAGARTASQARLVIAVGEGVSRGRVALSLKAGGAR